MSSKLECFEDLKVCLSFCVLVSICLNEGLFEHMCECLSEHLCGHLCLNEHLCRCLCLSEHLCVRV